MNRLGSVSVANLEISSRPHMLKLLRDPPHYLFFTGKGGVGKTLLACAAALAMADTGMSVLLVSTDPASNLDEMLVQKLSNYPSPIDGVPGLAALNIDPTAAAEAYRARVIAQMGDGAAEKERTNVREELSGACTTEIAAFDEFAGLLAEDTANYDHAIFDTVPTGDTLRLLSLPNALTGFLEGNDQGASCLGLHSGLKMQEERFKDAMVALADSQRTVFVLVTRPERSWPARSFGPIHKLVLVELSSCVIGVEGGGLIASGAGGRLPSEECGLRV